MSGRFGGGAFFHKADRDGLGKIAVGDGFNVGIDTAVKHMNNAGGIGGEGGVMSNHDDSVAFRMNLTKFFHNNVGRTRIKIASGLIGEDNFWFSDE